MLLVLIAVLIAERDYNIEPAPQLGKHVAEFPVSHTVTYLKWQDGGKRLGVGTLDGVLTTWDVGTGRLLSQVTMGRETRAYIFTSKGRVFTQHADGTIALRSEQTGEIHRVFDFGDEGKYGRRRVAGIRPLPNGRCLVVIHDERMAGGGEYMEIDPDRGASPSEWKSAPVLCPRGEHFGVWLDEETIALLDSKTKKRLRVIKVDAKGDYSLVLSDDCSKIALFRTTVTEGFVDIISARSSKVLSSIRAIPKFVTNVVFSHGGDYLLVLSERAYLYSVREGKKVISYGIFSAGAAAFTSDDRYVAIGHYNPSSSEISVRVFRVPKG